MTLLKNTPQHSKFNPQHYDDIFYYCENDHPFVAFTTCFCPVCETLDTIHSLNESLECVETALDELGEIHEQLVLKVYHTSPELLI